MRRSDRLLLVFVGLCAIQLCAPLSMIAKREATLRSGEVVKVRTAPVDPYDAFRGRYVAIRLELGDVINADGHKLERRQRVYVPFETDEDGFSTFGPVQTVRPGEGRYLKTRVNSWNQTTNKVHVERPESRFYMNERDAPEAERVYRQHSRRGKRDAYVTLRVRRGHAVIEQLYVGDLPIIEFLRKSSADAGK